MASMQESVASQQVLPQMNSLAEQHKLMSGSQESVGLQQVLPQMSSGSQQVPALGPLSMQTSVLPQQLSPTQGVLPGLQQSPIWAFKQISPLSQQATEPQSTGQQGGSAPQL
jgi:hypothetical protein